MIYVYFKMRDDEHLYCVETTEQEFAEKMLFLQYKYGTLYVIDITNEEIKPKKMEEII